MQKVDEDKNAAMTVEQWLAMRKDEALRVDPETAEVDWSYGQEMDPYLVYPDLPEEYWCIGRQHFARRPGSDIWVWFGDLPEAVHDALWAKHSKKLAFAAGLFTERDTSDNSRAVRIPLDDSVFLF